MEYTPITKCKYGKLADKVNLEPDFFSGFEPERRTEIVTEEAKFYRELTAPYRNDEKLDIDYLEVPVRDGTKIKVKTYRPKNNNDSLKPLVFIHGGGFITCSVETHDFVPSYLSAKAGIMAFNIEYRLSPENKFPVGIHDCYDVTKHIIEQSDKYRIDPNQLILCGDSSGGTFVAALTLMARDKKDFNIEKQILIYPATDFSGTIPKKSAEVYTLVGGDDYEGFPPMIVAYLDNPETQVKDPLVSPLLAESFENLPKALFIQAECDSLLDDGLIYAHVLQQSGVEVDYAIYEGMPHAFILRTYEETFDALNRMVKFIK